jgi:uncharacterized membrane protein (DUF4010 family)
VLVQQGAGKLGSQLAEAAEEISDSGSVRQGDIDLLLAGYADPRLAAVLDIVNRPLLERLVPPLALSAVALLVVAAMLARRAEGAASQAPPSGRPFALRPALVLAGLLTLALLISRAGTAWLGAGGAIAAAGLAGLVDAHAGALAAATLGARGELTLAEATWAVAASLGTNTGMKVVLAFAGGGARFGWPFAAAIAAAVTSRGDERLYCQVP